MNVYNDTECQVTIFDNGIVELDTSFGLIVLSCKSQKEIFKKYKEAKQRGRL